ncbi:MAG: Mini-ribonuclease 3 [Christensenellales bacterium]
MQQFIQAAAAALPMAEADARRLNLRVLAYVGDTVYDLFVRTRLIARGPAPAKRLHRMATDYVCAAGQQKSAQRIEPLLSEREADVLRRGRNYKMEAAAHKADACAYHWATGFEALLGYLYLSGQQARLTQLLALAVDPIEEVETCPKSNPMSSC